MDWFSVTVAAIKTFIFPPGLSVWLLLLGWLLWHRWHRLALSSLILSGLLMYFLSLPAVGLSLMTMLQSYPALSPDQLENPEPRAAIVILGGGRNENAPEFGGRDQVSAATMTRLRYGVYLHKQTGLPLLLSGGRVFKEAKSEAELMAEILTEYFQIQPRWLEGGSRNTEANVDNTVDVLSQAGIDTVYLVTHAWHMPRAMRIFTRTNVKVIAAPTAFVTPPKTVQGPLPWLPSMRGLSIVRTALHEYIGMLWYSMRALLGLTKTHEA
ncbi:MAG: YdcF family protein [Pseudomonadota bacterium]